MSALAAEFLQSLLPENRQSFRVGHSLQTALAKAESLLIGQRTQGYNTEMIRDFLYQVEMDLRNAIEENESPQTAGNCNESRLRHYVERYGQWC